MAELPSSLGSYRVQHQIGVGTLGPIFLASDEVLHVTAAVKVFDVDATPDVVAALVQRLNAAAARLSSHPGIIKLFEAGVANHVAYLATEHAEGMSLDARLRERDAALPRESLGWLAAIADAIDAIHADGVDHGSLHPRDIVLTLDGPRISGCGVARAVEEVGLRAPVRLPYTAPERTAGPSWGRAADVFSLAAIAFECLAGRRPTGTGRAAAKRLPPTVSPEYDRALVDVFARGLSADAERRPPSARAFVQALLDAGAAYVYGSDAKRGAVHHRAGTGARAAAKRAAAPTAAVEGATEDGELARFARDGVLPEPSRPSRTRRQMTRTAERKTAPEPSDASDPLTLFQPESDEPIEERPGEAGERGSKERRRRRTNGSLPTGGETADAADRTVPSSEPADVGRMADGEHADTASDVPARGGDEGSPETEMAFAPPSDLGQDPAYAPDEALQAHGEEEEYDDASNWGGEDTAEPSTADVRGESEGWLASTMPVPLVDAQDEVEYLPRMPDFAAGPGAPVPPPRFLDVDDPTDHSGRRQGPRELGGGMAEEAPESAGGVADPTGELTVSLDIGPNGRTVRWAEEHPAPAGAAAVGAARLFTDDADEWDEEADVPRRWRFLLPLLLLLLVVAAGAWFYGALTMPPSTISSIEEAFDPDAVSPPPSAAETPDAAAAGSSAPQESADGAVAIAEPEMPGAESPDQESSEAAGARRAAEDVPSPATSAPASPQRGTGASSAAAARGTKADDQGAARGRLLVRTSPSATVTVDGVPRGNSPVAVYALDWGAHTIVASRPGYADVSRRVMIAPDSPAVAVTIDLREEAAGAEGAEDAEDSTPTAPAATPTAQTAPAATAPAAAPSAGTGAIVTVTRPTGAQILIDGQSAGRTPATIPNVSSGSHTVRFELTGYRVWETRVTVEPGQRVRIAASLDRDR